MGSGANALRDSVVDKFDITIFALILVDNPALLAERSREATAVRDLRTLRNSFVHDIVGKAELSHEAFDEKWTTVARHLSLLARWAVGDCENLLQRKTTKIQR